MKKQTAVKISQADYLIHQDGGLFNNKNKKFKKWTKDSNGYMRCTVWNNNKSITISQHRILAEIFIPNILNKLQVNHINGVKHDNRLENLEWVTQSENTLHSFAMGLQKPSKPNMMSVIDKITGDLYDSISDAAKATGWSVSHLRNMLLKNKPNKTNLEFYGK
jgi:hypothetical protein